MEPTLNQLGHISQGSKGILRETAPLFIFIASIRLQSIQGPLAGFGAPQFRLRYQYFYPPLLWHCLKVVAQWKMPYYNKNSFELTY